MATPTLPNEPKQPNVQTFIDKFNKYYETNKFQIMQDLFYGLLYPNHPYSLANVAGLYDKINKPQLLPTLDITNVVQKSNSSEFNVKGDIKHDGRALTPMGWKVDMSFDFQKIWKEYLQVYNTARMGLIPNESNTLPELENYYHELIVKAAAADLREAIFAGVYNPSATAYGHLEFMNGFNKIFKDEALAGTFVPVAKTVTSANDVLDKITSMVRLLL